MTLSLINTPPIKRIEVNGTRRYETPDGVFPSVTTIIAGTMDAAKKKSLANWQKKIGFEESEKIRIGAGNRGTKIHEAVEAYLLGEPITITEEIEKYWKRFAKVLDRISNVRIMEGLVWDQLVGYAGTCDLVADYEGKGPCIIDWKSSFSAKEDKYLDDHKCQAASYGAAANKQYGLGIKSGYIIIAIENSEPQIVPLDTATLNRYYQVFVKRAKKYHADKGLN